MGDSLLSDEKERSGLGISIAVTAHSPHGLFVWQLSKLGWRFFFPPSSFSCFKSQGCPRNICGRTGDGAVCAEQHAGVGTGWGYIRTVRLLIATHRGTMAERHRCPRCQLSRICFLALSSWKMIRDRKGKYYHVLHLLVQMRGKSVKDQTKKNHIIWVRSDKMSVMETMDEVLRDTYFCSS